MLRHKLPVLSQNEGIKGSREDGIDGLGGGKVFSWAMYNP